MHAIFYIFKYKSLFYTLHIYRWKKIKLKLSLMRRNWDIRVPPYTSPQSEVQIQFLENPCSKGFTSLIAYSKTLFPPISTVKNENFQIKRGSNLPKRSTTKNNYQKNVEHSRWWGGLSSNLA